MLTRSHCLAPRLSTGFRTCHAGELEHRDGVADKVRALAEVVLAESTSTAADGPDAALQRCAAEMFAFAACIGSDGFASQLARAVCQAAAESTSVARCAICSFQTVIRHADCIRLWARHERCALAWVGCSTMLHAGSMHATSKVDWDVQACFLGSKCTSNALQDNSAIRRPRFCPTNRVSRLHHYLQFGWLTICN